MPDHVKDMLEIYDENCIIDQAIWDSVEAAIDSIDDTTGFVFKLFGSPRREVGVWPH